VIIIPLPKVLLIIGQEFRQNIAGSRHFVKKERKKA
jgi:hypothetical protein